MADDLERRFPENTVFNIHYLPMVRVAAAIRSGNPAKAIEAIAEGERYELGAGTSIILYRVYLRGWLIGSAAKRTGTARFRRY
jgi:hypothetical protein